MSEVRGKNLRSVKKRPQAFEHVAESLKEDKEFVLEAVRVNGKTFKYASDNLRVDKEFVCRAAEISKVALKYANANIWKDKDFLLQAAQVQKKALRYATGSFWDDRDFVMQAMKIDWDYAFTASLLPERIERGHVDKVDKELLMEFISSSDALRADRLGWVLHGRRKVLGDLASDRDVITAIVQKNGLSLGNFGASCRCDEQIALEAVKQNGVSLRFVASSLKEKMQTDLNTMCLAVASNPRALKFVQKPLDPTHPQLVAAAGLKQGKFDYKSLAVMSVRFSLREGASQIATAMHQALAESDDFDDIFFYDPNLVSKGFCGPTDKMTDKEWLCRGACRRLPHVLKYSKACHCGSGLLVLFSDRPIDQTCWRKSYRWHLTEAARVNGFMLQIVEQNEGEDKFVFGGGQEIEEEIASLVGLKVFSVEVCMCLFKDDDESASGSDVKSRSTCDLLDVGEAVVQVACLALARAIEKWQADGCQDMRKQKLGTFGNAASDSEFGVIESEFVNRDDFHELMSHVVGHEYEDVGLSSSVDDDENFEAEALKLLRPQHLAPVDAWITVGTPDLMQNSGSFYHEVKLGRGIESLQIGWVTEKFQKSPYASMAVWSGETMGVGDDAEGWAVDGIRHRFWHNGEECAEWPRRWKEGDVIGLAIDIKAGIMQFSINGDWVESLRNKLQAAGKSVYPAVSATGDFLILLAPFAWRYSPPSDEHKAWAESGIYERPVEKANIQIGDRVRSLVHGTCDTSSGTEVIEPGDEGVVYSVDNEFPSHVGYGIQFDWMHDEHPVTHVQLERDHFTLIKQARYQGDDESSEEGSQNASADEED